MAISEIGFSCKKLVPIILVPLFVLLFLLVVGFAFQAKAANKTDLMVMSEVTLILSKHIKWPQNHISAPDKTLRIGLVTSDQFKKSLTEVAQSKKVKLKVSIFKRLSDVKDCDIVIFDDSQDIKKWDPLGKNKTVMTVGYSRGFAKQGGMVGFEIVNNKIQFDLNLTQMKKQKFQVPNPILRLVRKTY